MTAEPWFHEYGFTGGEDFERVVEYATDHGFAFVYGGATKDPAWVGYPAEYEALQALVVSERERADKAEQERDEALQAARDGGWEMSSEEEVRHLAGMLESQNLMTVEAEARAERAETALREIAESQQATSSGDIPPEDLQWEPLPGAAAQAIARAVLSGLVGDTEERQPCS